MQAAQEYFKSHWGPGNDPFHQYLLEKYPSLQEATENILAEAFHTQGSLPTNDYYYLQYHRAWKDIRLEIILLEFLMEKGGYRFP